MKKEKKKIKIDYILSLSRSGSTKYGEMLCEKYNNNKEKTIFLGEVSNYINGIKEEINISQKYCSCEKKYKNCNFWGNINRSIYQKKTYKNIINFCKKKGYKRIIDSSKRLYPLKIYNELNIDFTIHLIIRNPFSWVKSVIKHKNKRLAK